MNATKHTDVMEKKSNQTSQQTNANNTLIEDILVMNLNNNRDFLEDVTLGVEIYRELQRRATPEDMLSCDTLDRGIVMDIVAHLNGSPVIEYQPVIDTLVDQGLLPQAEVLSIMNRVAV